MTAIRSRVGTALTALAVSALAPAIVLGTTAAASAAQPRLTARPSSPALTGVTWHRLTLRNGWLSSQTQYQSGNPRWAIRNGVVYLSGSMHQRPGYLRSEFAVLPRAARPAVSQFIMVYTVNGTAGYLEVAPTGAMYANSSPQSHAQGYTSLAGISFTARSMARHRLTLRNGWKSAQGPGAPAYDVSAGVVYLSGLIEQPGVGTDHVTVLPKAARPGSVMWLTVYTAAGTTGILVIYRTGVVRAIGAHTRGLTSLAGISYPVASATRHKLALSNGWISDDPIPGSGDPAYEIHDGIVYLSGSLHQPVTSSDVFAVLPPAARPRHDLYLATYTGATGAPGTLFIEPNGEMSAYNVPAPADAPSYTSLAAISYPLGS